METPHRIRVLLVDDDPGFAAALALALELYPTLAVVGRAENGRRGVELARALAPDVVLMDVEMPVLDGLAATERLRALAPETRVVVLSGHGSSDVVDKAYAAGAAAFVAKGRPIQEVVDAVVRAHEVGRPHVHHPCARGWQPGLARSA